MPLHKYHDSPPPSLEITVIDNSTGEILPIQSILYPKCLLPEPIKDPGRDSLSKSVNALLLRTSRYVSTPGEYYCPDCKCRIKHIGYKFQGHYKANTFKCSCGFEVTVRIRTKRIRA